jgi:hypothetical protein
MSDANFHFIDFQNHHEEIQPIILYHNLAVLNKQTNQISYDMFGLHNGYITTLKYNAHKL